MATDVERLIVTMEARTKEFERAVLKMEGTTKAALLQIERDMQASATRTQATWAKFGTGIDTTLRRSFAPLAALTAGLFSGREIIAFADSFTRIENAMKVAGLEGEQLTGTMESLFEIATKNGAPVEALATLYGRLALVQNELNISSEDLLGFSDNVAASLRVSGKSAAEASGALLQLSQALGSGVVRAEEFNSILAGAPAIAQAVARGLTEAGGSVAKLRTLVIEGQVSSEAFFKAFQLGSVETQRQALLAERTIGQAWENIRTSFTQAVGNINDVTGASSFLTSELDKLAKGAKATGEEIEFIVRVGKQLAGVFDQLTSLSPPAAQGLNVEGLRASIAQWEGLLAEAEARGETAAAENMRARIRELEAEIVKGTQSLIGPAWEQAGRGSAEAFAAGFQTISIEDAVANDLAGALDAVLDSQKKLFSGFSGRGGRGPVIDLEFRTIGEGEQLQAIIRQRDAVAALNADVEKLERALSAHFDTPFDDIMGFGAAEGARAAFAAAISDIERLSQAFVEGRVPADQFDAEMQAIRERLATFAGTGNTLDPFINNALKAVSVVGQLRGQLDQATSSFTRMGLASTRQGFNVPSAGGGTANVGVIRPIPVEPKSVAQGVEQGMDHIDKRLADGFAILRSQSRGSQGVIQQAFASQNRMGDLIFRAMLSGAQVQGRQLAAAIDRQTAALHQTVASIAQGGERGPFGGSAGGSETFRINPNAAAQGQIERMARERQVLQTGLQFKQLSPEQTEQTEQRLAEIDLETARLQQSMGETADAFKALTPLIDGMARAGADAAFILHKATLLTGLGSGVSGFAEGGAVRGPGSSRSDSVPAMLSDGEYVVNAAATKKHRALLESINSGKLRALADGGLVARVNASARRFADGGMVRARPAAAAGAGSRDINISMTVMAQDADSFRYSERDIGRQIAAEVQYAIEGG